MPRLGSIIEGSTRLVVPSSGNLKGPGTRASVFYNPAMRTNRDLTVLFGRAAAKDTWRVLDALGGTGAKGIRLARESGKDLTITVNDISRDAFATIKKNIRANKLENATARNMEYNALLSSEGYEWIDIDPFGSPVKFLDLGIQRISRNGVLSITATDTAPLCGAKPEACVRRYQATPMRSGCSHEFGLRILVGNAVRRAAAFDIGLEPVFSYYQGHYFRAYFRVGKGAGKADAALAGIGYVASDEKKGYSVHDSEPAGKHAGPLWTRELWDPDIVARMLAASDESMAKESVALLAKMNGEMLLPPYYHHVDHLARRFGMSPPRTAWLLERLGEMGFRASAVHYGPKGIKTDAGLRELGEIFNTASH